MANAISVATARRLLQSGRLADAADLTERLSRTAPDDPEVLRLIVDLASRARQPRRAVEAAVSLAGQLPDDGAVQALLARCLLSAGDVDAACEAAGRATAMGGDRADILSNASVTLSAAGRHDAAYAGFQRAVALLPDDPRYLFNLAMEQRFMGRLEEAEATLDKVIAFAPDHAEAWLIRSGLREQTEGANHVAAIRGRLAVGADGWRAAAQLHYALAKELEDLGAHREAFRALADGAAVRRAHMKYDVASDLRIMDALTARFDAGVFADPRVAGCDSDEPIFIIGLPRSGTTLAERILSSHPDVDSVGEASAFTDALMSILADTGKRGLDGERLAAAARDIDPRRLGEAYLARVEGLRAGARRFVDKLPFNYLNVGLIRRALPRARIVHLRRDPMDACYAMFKTWFAEAYPFSYDLDDLGRYYVGYHRLMAHWRSIPDMRFYDLDYERLVVDFENEARQLLAHCGLDWDPTCAKFEHNSAASTTASAAQVRRPVYRTSIGNWRHHETVLRGVRRRLIESGIVAE